MKEHVFTCCGTYEEMYSGLLKEQTFMINTFFANTSILFICISLSILTHKLTGQK